MLQRLPSKASEPEEDLEKGGAGISSQQNGASSSGGGAAADGAAARTPGCTCSVCTGRPSWRNGLRSEGSRAHCLGPRARGGARDAEFFAVRTLASRLR